jgi:hypothetical protein
MLKTTRTQGSKWLKAHTDPRCIDSKEIPSKNQFIIIKHIMYHEILESTYSYGLCIEASKRHSTSTPVSIAELDELICVV